MTRPLVAYTDVVDTDPGPGVQMLEEAGFEVRVLGTADPGEIARGAADAVALLIGYSPVTRPLIEALPRLRVVATQSVGTEMVDVEACRDHGVAVTNVPGAATEEVATHALAMSLSLVRGLPMLDRDVRSGVWDGTRHDLRRPSELIVGVVGLGRIGARYASLARGVFGDVQGYDPYAAPPAGVRASGLDDLLASSDLISLHLPSTPESRGIIGADAIARLRRGAFLVNVARGDLVDESALLAALDSAQVSAAALDVLVSEPPEADDPLVRHARTLVTPHAGYLSPATEREYVLTQARKVLEHLGIPA